MNSLITALPLEGLEDIIRTVPLDYAIFNNTEQFSNCSEQGGKAIDGRHTEDRPLLGMGQTCA